MAVEKVVAWYNKHLKAVLGHPHQTLMINDPMGEVSYEDGFVCTDLQNKYLDDETIERDWMSQKVILAEMIQRERKSTHRQASRGYAEEESRMFI